MLNLKNPRLFLWPLVILLFGLALTGAAWRYASLEDDKKSLAAFNLHARDASHDIQNRANIYFGVLRSAGSFLAGSNSVTHTQWSAYVNFLKPKENYPGIEGMGVIRYIPDSQKSIFENTVRHENSQSQADYIIRPPGARKVYYPVEHFWPPLTDITLPGLDHGAYPNGLKALEKARDSGMVTVSRDLPYAKTNEHSHIILFIFPVYRNGLPTTTIGERQKAIWGFVYARVKVEDLIRDAISSSIADEIYLEIFEGRYSSQEIPSVNNAHLIYNANPSDIPRALNASYKPRHHSIEEVSIDGISWLFYSASRHGGVSEPINYVPLFILLTGSLLSIGASGIAFLRSRQRQLIHRHAYYDCLTGLPNRMLLQDRFQQALANAQRHGTGMALLFLDLDNFKPINDNLGHAIGDKVLKAVAACSSSCLREGDTLSRLGGDEFVILLLNIGQEEASVVARKIIDAISRLIPLEGKDIQLSGSIGISMFPMDGSGFEELLKSADAAMYHAKEIGRNNFQFYAQSYSGHRAS